ncbi:MAG: hypothetical protein HY698_10585 [Deltaproteobacteria bacterium]|nr:hypothetical protein [Deltaproteobacteria bacterium]
MRRAGVFLVLLAQAACSRRDGGHDEPLPLLRVSTYRGLEPMGPTVTDSTTRHLMNLVYTPLLRHFRELTRSGSAVRLMRREDSPLSSQELSSAMRHPKLISAHPDEQGVTLAFTNKEIADTIQLDFVGCHLLDLGPYEQESFTEKKMVLRRRVPGTGPARIQVQSMSEEEEWRLLLGGSIDVLPVASPSHLTYLRSIPSLKVVPVKDPGSIALIFLTTSAGVPDARARRGMSLALRRRAIAEVVTGEQEDAVPTEEDLEEARRLLAAAGIDSNRRRELGLLYHSESTDFERAAMVVQHQLAPLGVDVTIVPVNDHKTFRERVLGEAFHAYILFGGNVKRYWYQLESGAPGNMSRYSSPEFDAAARAGDEPLAKRIVERDSPLTPLYYIREGAAARRDLCGIKPEVTRLDWLAGVHRCTPGELE